jgi:hypothetical protein
MSIDTVEDWSTTAASNTTLGPTLTLNGAVMKPSEVDNAFRELMAQVATFNIEPTFANGIDFTNTAFTIKPTTIDGADNAAVWIQGGGDASTSRGAIVIAYGNEGLSPGNIRLIPGTTATTGVSVEGNMGVTGNVDITSTDAGAAAGPTFSLSRNSASPAASDIMGFISFLGRDSGGNNTTYADMFATIADPTDGSEDSNLTIRTIVAGVATNQILMNTVGCQITAIGASVPGTGVFTTLTGTTIRLTSTITWTQGTGTPEGVVTASVGSLFSRTDAATTLYVKQTGAGNTGWVAK